MRAARVANCILVGAAAALGLFVKRAIALLRELHGHGAAVPMLLWLVVAAGITLAVACLLALRLRPSRRVNVALAVGAAAFTLYSAELALALRGRGRAAVRLRHKLAFLDGVRAQGIAVSPGVEPVRFMWLREPSSPQWVMLDGQPTLPLGGISRRRTVDCKEAGDWMVFDTDEHGFHNPPGLWTAPSLEIAFVGDSFVHGSCVPSGENMVARVRERHPSTLGLGMPGSGPLSMLAEVREYLPALRPRTVVWCYFSGNDLLDLRRERQHPLLARYLEAGYGQDLARRQPALDRALEEYVETSLLPRVRRLATPRPAFWASLALRQVRSMAGVVLADPYELAPNEEEFQLFARVLREAQATVAGWGGRIVFVYLPGWAAPPRQLGEDEYARAKEAAGRRTRALVKEVGLPLVDVEERFARQPHPESLYACPGCHYGPAGYALAAQAVLEALDGARP